MEGIVYNLYIKALFESISKEYCCIPYEELNQEMAVNRKSRKILLAAYFLLTFSLVLSVRNPRWQEIAQWDGPRTIFDLPDSKEQQKVTDDYDCNNADGQCDLDKEGKELLKMLETNEIPYKRKPNSGLATLTYDKFMQLDSSKPGIIPYFHTSSIPLPCSCGSHYRLMDLGRSYYPRYLPTAVCDPDACGALGTHQCRPRPYHVKVLRRKDMVGHPPEREPYQVNNPILPDEIKKNWALDTFTVTVACECGS